MVDFISGRTHRYEGTEAGLRTPYFYFLEAPGDVSAIT